MSQDFYQISILPFSASIIKICRAYTNSQEDFEDYYQEVSLQIWRSKDNFREQCKWSTWIYRISLNVCLTLLKKKKRTLLMLYFSGRIYRWEVRLMYGHVFDKLEETIAEMEQLKQG